MNYPDSQILSILMEIGAISHDTKVLIQLYMEKWELDSYDAVIQTNIISSDELKNILANSLNLKSLDSVSKICTSETCLSKVKYDDAKRWNCIPVGFENAGKIKILKIILSDPSSKTLLKEIREKTEAKLDIVVGSRQEIRTAIFNEYPLVQQLPLTFLQSEKSNYE